MADGTGRIQYERSTPDTQGDAVYSQVTNGAGHVYDATLRSGEDQTNDVMVVEQGRFWPEVLAGGAAADVLPVGGIGASGDYLESVTFPITTATGTCVITDGTYTVTFPVATIAGTYPLHWTSSGAGFTVTNTNDASIVICTGRFTA